MSGDNTLREALDLALHILDSKGIYGPGVDRIRAALATPASDMRGIVEFVRSIAAGEWSGVPETVAEEADDLITKLSAPPVDPRDVVAHYRPQTSLDWRTVAGLIQKGRDEGWRSNEIAKKITGAPPVDPDIEEAEVERVANALYECERERSNNCDRILAEAGGKPLRYRMEHWNDVADLYRGDARAALAALRGRELGA